MRMWTIDPVLLCNKHLFIEHNKLHKLSETIKVRQIN